MRLQRKEIAFIKPLRGRLQDERARTHQKPWFLTALIAPAVWVPALILLGRRQARLRHDLGFARAGRARTRARKHLRATERRMANLDAGGFHEEVARSLVEYVADRFDRPPSGLTYEVADSLLEHRGVNAALRGRFRACLERCDLRASSPIRGARRARWKGHGGGDRARGSPGEGAVRVARAAALALAIGAAAVLPRVAAETPEGIFNQANAAYEKGNYQDAVRPTAA